MFKKIYDENNTSTESESGSLTENELKIKETNLSRVIGALNVKKWNALKALFFSKTNEEFVTKLLDIAQEFLDRQGAKEINDTQLKKQKKLKKNKIFYAKETNETNINKETVSENHENKHSRDVDTQKQTENTPKEKTENKTSKSLTKPSPKLDTSSKTKPHPFEPKIKQLPLKDIDICKNPPATDIQTKKTPEKSKVVTDLDKIRIKLCHQCNTHHILDHCPINFPHYIINDALSPTSWQEKYKVIHKNHVDEVKNENNTDPADTDQKYAFSTLSLPSSLCFKDTNSAHGLGIYTNNDVEPFTQFGPLLGQVVKEMDIPEDINMKCIWQINHDSAHIYFNTESTATSNWLRYIRPAPTRDERNLTVISKEMKLYFVSVKFIKTGEELLYWQDSATTTASRKKMEKTTCGGCNMDFSHPHYYRIHCSLFHDVRYSLTIKKYHCKVCGAAVLGKENIMKHAAELHNGRGAYQCQFCKKFFLRLNYLEMHRTYGCSANPHRSRPLCDFCGKKFCQPQKLKVHIKRMHSDISQVLKEFQCKDCLKILGSRAALQRHAKEVHQKQTEGQCSCSRCGKKFQNKSNLKIHMLTHSGIKPFKCNNCSAAFTTKQCLQFHYKKVHNLTDENMPKIERSIDYTFQAYSGSNEADSEKSTNPISPNPDRDTDTDNESLDSENIDDPTPLDSPSPRRAPAEFRTASPTPSRDNYVKVLSKGSKKWIGETPLSKDDLTIIEADMYEKNKLQTTSMSEFGRQDASNASLLVEAALDSVCNEPNMDIDVSSAPNCTDSLVNNLYGLTQADNLPEVAYSDACINDSSDINLMSPSVNDRVSVTDELPPDDDMHYANFHQNDFSPPNSPDIHRSNFVRNYINSLSPPHNATYEPKNVASPPVPSPPRYDFGHAISTEHPSSDDSNGMTVQNLSLNDAKHDDRLDMSLYKSTGQDYARKMKFDSDAAMEHHHHIDVIGDIVEVGERDELSSSDMRSKFDLELDARLKGYDSVDGELLRQRTHAYDTGADLDFRSKSYDLSDVIESRSKPYDVIESEFRPDRTFEPLVLNPAELQGLDMSARSFHNYNGINRYHALYPEVDRVDLRLGYSPPPPTYTHADILRVVSLDLTPPGRHSVDLSLRNHPLHHQMASTRLLGEHGLQGNPHRLLDQSRLLGTELAAGRHLSADRIMSESGGSRILTDHSTSRILNNEQLGSNHLLGGEQRLLGDEGRLLPAGGAVSPPPVQAFTGYSVAQNPYHPTAMSARPHVTSPTSSYHYPTYY